MKVLTGKNKMNDLKKLLQRRRSKFYNFNSSEERKKEGKKVKKKSLCVCEYVPVGCWVCPRTEKLKLY